MTENTCTFTADTLTINGSTFPAEYSVDTCGTVFVSVPVNMDGSERTMRIKISADDSRYAAALAAAEQAADQAEPAPEAEPAEPAEPARDPKQACGPVPDKLFVGMEIKGKGWKIVFDGGYDRTRVIFKRRPSEAAREAVKAAGFYWSPALESWNKKLSFKAFRAAQELAQQLRTICG